MSAIATEPPFDRSDDFSVSLGRVRASSPRCGSAFSFYGMKALLLLYLLQHHKFGDKGGLDVLELYGGLVVLPPPVIGGVIADRWLACAAR